MAGLIRPFWFMVEEVREAEASLTLRFDLQNDDDIQALPLEIQRNEYNWRIQFLILKSWNERLQHQLGLSGIESALDFEMLPRNRQREYYFEVLNLRGNFKKLLLDIEIKETQEDARRYYL